MAHFLHIGFDPKREDEKLADDLDEIFNKGIDWIRYAPYSWILYTRSSPNKWHERLEPFRDRAQYLIFELNINNRQGWMQKDVWTWLKKERKDKQPTVPPIQPPNTASQQPQITSPGILSPNAPEGGKKGILGIR